MSWSHRAVLDEHGTITIREVFWNKSAANVHHYNLTYKHVWVWTRDAVAPQGETVEEIREELDRFALALALPVLVESLMEGSDDGTS